MSIKDKYTVKIITKEEYAPWLLKKHYAKRIPSISYAYGLYDDKNIIQGVCSYGTPASSSLLIGVCGEGYKYIVKELNRLVINQNEKNLASFFISMTFKLLPKPLIIISYADTSQDHHGFVYQATNFIYTGLSAKRTDWRIKGMEHLHGCTIADKSRGKENRVEYMKMEYGDRFYIQNRPRKHRYIMFLGNKREKAVMKKALKYKIEPYPKGQNKNYDASYEPEIQLRFF
jgi:hypothetical protein